MNIDFMKSLANETAKEAMGLNHEEFLDFLNNFPCKLDNEKSLILNYMKISNEFLIWYENHPFYSHGYQKIKQSTKIVSNFYKLGLKDYYDVIFTEEDKKEILKKMKSYL